MKREHWDRKYAEAELLWAATPTAPLPTEQVLRAVDDADRRAIDALIRAIRPA